MTALIGLDWGTTSLRAYRVAADGAVLERRESARGILNVPDGDFAAVCAETIGDWRAIAPRAPVLASGMIGSRQGWREAPYVPCPAGLGDFARGFAEVDGVRIVPGLSCIDGDGVPDVMRGEETQLCGLGAADGLAVLPGTHSKWAVIKGGRITRFATFMTGEVFAVLRAHSILGRGMSGSAIAPGAFARGLALAATCPPGPGGLLHRLFAARTLGLFEQADAAALPGILSGLLIGAEIATARGWAEGQGVAIVIGGADLAQLYRHALEQAGMSARVAPPDLAASGLVRIARAAGLIA